MTSAESRPGQMGIARLRKALRFCAGLSETWPPARSTGRGARVGIGLFLQAFEADRAHSLFFQLHVYQWQLALQAVADELNNVFFFGCCQDIAGSARGKREGLQVAHLVKWNQDNGTAEPFVFPKDREVLEAAAFSLVAEAGGIDKVSG